MGGGQRRLSTSRGRRTCGGCGDVGDGRCPGRRGGGLCRNGRHAGITDSGVRVAEGLKAGDVVVAAGTQFMTENLKVKLPSEYLAEVAAELLQ